MLFTTSRKYLSAIAVLLLITSIVRKPVEPIHTIETIFFKIHHEPFSEDLLIEAIKEFKLDHPHVVLAQAKLETGHFTSSIFLENNNLFGMKVARARPTTAIGSHRGHAVYRSWRESLIDYLLYSAYYVKSKEEEEFYNHLENNYAEDPIYTSKLKQVVTKEQLVTLF